MKIAGFIIALLVLSFHSAFTAEVLEQEQFPKIFVKVRASETASATKETTWYAILDVKSIQKDRSAWCELDLGKYRYTVDLRYEDGEVKFFAGQVVKGEKHWGYASLFHGAVSGMGEQGLMAVSPSYYELRIYQIKNSRYLELDRLRAKEDGYKNLSCSLISSKASP